jgi:proline iminopeptidase
MTGRVVLTLLAALLGVVAGLGALLGLAMITDLPPLFLLAGLLAFCAAYLLGLLLATRKVGPDRRRVRAALFCAGTAMVIGLFAWMALLPMGDPRLPPAPVEGQRIWELSTGSRIATSASPPRAAPKKRPSSSFTAVQAPPT